MKNLVIIGSTGSIGCQTLDVVRAHPDRLRVVGLAARQNAKRLAQQVAEFRPEAAALVTDEALPLPAGTQMFRGRDGIIRLARWEGADGVVAAATGIDALWPMVEAIRAGKTVCFSAKEPLVAAGQVMCREAAQHAVRLIPIDSEMSAILQCLNGEDSHYLRRIWLTASGGPCRKMSHEEMAGVTVEQALNHPTWEMGSKVTIDSATLMNKGLEVIEAHQLFGVPIDNIEVLIHPQSMIHSMVEFADGSVIAQLGCPDMRVPIQYALLHPERPDNSFTQFDPLRIGVLEFEPPDERRFPCLALAYRAARQGGIAPAVLNAANEVANVAFRGGAITLTDIPRLVEGALDAIPPQEAGSLEAVLEADCRARDWVRKQLQNEKRKFDEPP